MVDFQERDTSRGLDDLAGDDGKGDGGAAREDDDDSGDHGHGSDGHDGDGHDGDGHDHHGQENDQEHDHHDHAEEHDHHDHDHDHHDHDVAEVGAAVVTVSSTRSLSEDPAGDAIVAALEDGGNVVVTRELVADDLDGVQSTVNALVGRRDVDAVVTTGGTGVTPDDVTVEAVEPLLDKSLPGFGELFRALSYEEVGTKVVATRATAGVAEGVPVFCLPGSENAARLGAEEVVAPEVGHLAGLASRDEEEE